MTHKLIKTDNYLLVVDNSVHPYDSSKVGNPLAHLPLNGSPVLEGVDLLPPYSRHQEDGLEELAEMNYPMCEWAEEQCLVRRLAFMNGYNKAREKYKYTEEDMIICWNTAYIDKHQIFGYQIGGYHKKFIQSIHQYPTEFECEMEDYGHYEMGIANFIKHGERPKTITTAQGVQWVGKYK
jgi:hypothetical protein